MKEEPKDDTIITGIDLPSSIYRTHYHAPFMCANCGHSDRVMVKKETLRKGLKVPCNNCGCEIAL